MDTREVDDEDDDDGFRSKVIFVVYVRDLFLETRTTGSISRKQNGGK